MTSSSRIPLPRHPEPPARQPFPLLACLAPVVASGLIFAVTGSTFALIFAVLGPLVAMASLADSRIGGRRTARRDRARFRADVAATRELVERRHAAELIERTRRHPGAGQLLDLSVRDPERWRGSAGATVTVRIGAAAQPSSLEVEQPPPLSADTMLDSLVAHAAVLDGAPLVVDAALGIGIHGVRIRATALARGLLLQLAAVLSPARFVLVVESAGRTGGDLDWLRGLPHDVRFIEADSSADSGGPGRLAAGDWTARWLSLGGSSANPQPGSESEIFLVAVAATAAELPTGCRAVIAVGRGGAATLEVHPARMSGTRFEPEALSEQQAVAGARLLTEAAGVLGITPPTVESAETRPLVELLPVGTAHAGPVAGPLGDNDGRSLSSRFAWQGAHPIELDLVRDGPHALVGGTTGSGKSELLTSWVLALAANHPPERLNLLLVDFKGGSAFGMVQRLPHLVGLVTDLDARVARRALESLRAELRHRERTLAAAGVRAIHDLPPDAALPRLVIVVDEFAAAITEYPELHDLFADLAARGRSLGIHLILCTQRPSGAMRDGILANAELRISLRVNNRADSIAVIGTADAAALPGGSHGRAFVSVGGSEPRQIAIALATTEDAERVAVLWSAPASPLRRPWCDELPRLVTLESLATPPIGEGDNPPPVPTADAIAFGLADLPHEQRQETAAWSPSAHGNLLVVGGQGAGKSTLLQTLAQSSRRSVRELAPEVVRVPAVIDAAWDIIRGEAERVRSGIRAERLLLIDDLDSLLARYSDEYAAELVDALVALLRDGSAVGLRVVLTTRRITSLLHSIAASCDARLVLRMPSRQEHLVAGGSAEGWLANGGELAEGAGEWRGNRVQVAVVPSPEQTTTGVASIPGTQKLELDGRSCLVVVSSNPAGFEERLRRRASGQTGIEMVRLDMVQPGESNPAVRRGGIEVVSAGRCVVIIGTPSGWQSEWTLLSTLRAKAAIVFDGVSTADFRAISAQRVLPPPLVPGDGTCWIVEPGQPPQRAVP